MMSLRKQRVPLAYRIVGRHLHRFVYRLVTGPLDADRMFSHRHGVFHDRRLPDVCAIDENLAVRVSGNGDQAFSRGLRRGRWWSLAPVVIPPSRWRGRRRRRRRIGDAHGLDGRRDRRRPRCTLPPEREIPTHAGGDEHERADHHPNIRPFLLLRRDRHAGARDRRRGALVTSVGASADAFRAGGGGRRWLLAAPALGTATGCSGHTAVANSSIVRKRWSGSLDSARVIAAVRNGGVSLRFAPALGTSSKMCL